MKKCSLCDTNVAKTKLYVEYFVATIVKNGVKDVLRAQYLCGDCASKILKLEKELENEEIKK